MAAIFWGEENFLKIAKSSLIPCGSKSSMKSLSHTVKELEANLRFPFWAKIQNGRHFWGEEIFFENCQEYTG